METELQSNTPETDKQSFVAEHNEGRELCVEAWFCEIIERKRDTAIRKRDEAVRSCHIWQKGHSDIVADRDLWKAEAERWKTISQTQTTQHYANPN